VDRLLTGVAGEDGGEWLRWKRNRAHIFLRMSEMSEDENNQSKLEKDKSAGRKPWGPTYMQVMVTMFLFHAYFGRPVEPWMPNESELIVITGMANYEYANSTKSSVGGNYLRVNGQVLHCQFGYFGASGGCNFPGVWWDKNKPVSATYFYMRTRLGLRTQMLHSLMQNGQQVILPQRTLEGRILNFKSRGEVYYQIFIFNFFMLVFAWFADRQVAKDNSIQS
jgi:hypothetical protein